MGKLIKRGTKGAASNYITRTRAIRKLQISIAEFRRLCILKGIYPREPKNKKKASGNNNNNNTFYLTKDIMFLMHEPLVAKFREQKVFLKKISKAIARREESIARSLEENMPVYSLDHLVKERYPSFIEAIKDLDDCLCHLYLFASLPSSEKIPQSVIVDSQRLCAEFMNLVITSHTLQKTFVSIKGIYYQCKIKDTDVTWLVPYQFSTPIPNDVDLKVMLTFLEFYRCLMEFVNFKLYSEQGLKYPPVIKSEVDEAGGGWLLSYPIEEPVTVPVMSKKQAKKQIKSLSSKLNDIKEPEDADDVVEEVEVQEDKLIPSYLFSNHSVFLSREVPRYSLEFVLKSFGAKVSWSETCGGGSPCKEDDSSITLQIVDRPVESIKILPGRVYVQPQWVYDCVNAGMLLDEGLYAPGKSLPPHLSPFKPYENLENVLEDEDGVVEGESDDGEGLKEESEDELVEEKPTPEVQKKKQVKEEEQRIELAKMKLSNTKRKLVERIQEAQQNEKEKELKLLKRRKQLAKKNK